MNSKLMIAYSIIYLNKCFYDDIHESGAEDELALLIKRSGMKFDLLIKLVEASYNASDFIGYVCLRCNLNDLKTHYWCYIIDKCRVIYMKKKGCYQCDGLTIDEAYDEYLSSKKKYYELKRSNK